MVPHQTIIILPLLLNFLSKTYCYTFKEEDAILITNPADDKTSNYFGYTVLLQNGNNPIVTVGAPKGISSTTKRYEGEVFQCQINSPHNCKTAFKNHDKYYSPNGDFLGAALDGDDNANGLVIACSPRTSFYPILRIRKIIYLDGKCLFRKNSTDLAGKVHNITISQIKGAAVRIQNKQNEPVYYYGFGQLGFDISIYEKDNILCGIPGLIRDGGAITFPAPLFEKQGPPGTVANVTVTQIPKTSIWNRKMQDQYFGYSLKATKDLKTNETLFVIGEPRGNDLKGKVHLYSYSAAKEKLTEKQTLMGNEFGSYFGASVLAVDLTGDDMLDILVGAPLSAGKTYDEGSVYYFDNIQEPKKLTGLNKIRSKFGMSLASLGDIDLDGFNDVAISAPYEDHDRGAVYIYRGGPQGLQDQFDQRLSPSTINNALNARGFGLGISRGNDIDNNGHNDIAIGAYKSDQVFIIKSYGIVDYQAWLTTNINGLKENVTQFQLQLKVIYSKRSAKLHVPTLNFDLKISLDYRSVQEEFKDILTLSLEKSFEKTYQVQVRPISNDTSPFTIKAQLTVNDKNIKGFGNDLLKMEIPYAIGCSSNICITGLTIQVKAKSTRLIVGQDHNLDLEITVTNEGDPAFQCYLIIQAPPVLSLRTLRDCNHKGGNYSCFFSEKLDRNKNKTESYIFDVRGLLQGGQLLQINVSVTSYGTNNKLFKNKEFLIIPVMTKGTSYMVGESLPSSMNLDPDMQLNNTQVIHRFVIGKQGILPLKLNATVLVPVENYSGKKLFTVMEITNEDGLITCTPFDSHVSVNEADLLSRENIPRNKRLLIYCHQGQECARFNCQGLLGGTVKKTIIELKLIIISRLLVKKYKKELQQKNLIVYLPVIILPNSAMANDWVLEPAPFLIFVPHVIYLPLWIFVVSCLVGLILFLIIVITLNKCSSFFQRDYKHLMEQEISKSTKHIDDIAPASSAPNIYS